MSPELLILYHLVVHDNCFYACSPSSDILENTDYGMTQPHYIKTTRNCYLRDECYYQKYSDMAVFRIEEYEYRDQLLQKAKEILLAECPDKVFDECL